MNIALIGFMGCGKSFFARQLAQEMNMQIVDSDHLIVKKVGMSIPEIFKTCGEDAFREAESAVIAEIMSTDKQIVSLGGGAVLRERNREILKPNCKLVFLDTPFDICWERISRRDTRPLISGKSKEEVRKIYDERLAIYRECATHTISNPQNNTKTLKTLLQIMSGRQSNFKNK